MDEGRLDSGLHFSNLSIEGFRGIKKLSISPLGRVTLITGKNNTGKSSILEALRLHTHMAAPQVVYDILSSREEYIRELDERNRSYDPRSMFHASALFHGFPLLSQDLEPIGISTGSKMHPMKLTIRVGRFEERENEDGSHRLVELKNDRSPEPTDIVALVVDTWERRNIHRIETLSRNARINRVTPPRSPSTPRIPCLLVSPYGGEGTSSLGYLWDRISLTDSQKYVVEALQIIDPRISDVSMIGGEERSRGRRAIVRADNIPIRVPLRSFGDGVNRLFAIALSLVNARGGILLIDEFENGLHYSVQLDAWRMIFKIAQDLDVQVFATTHSWDAVEAFQKAASNTPEEGVLLNLTRRSEDVIPTVFVEEELAIVTRDKIEVR